MSLLGCINNGLQVKRVADTIIDSCKCVDRVITKDNFVIGAHVLNLRDSILSQRVKASLVMPDEARKSEPLSRAVKALEK